jgi:hypothetical protein
MSLTLLTPDELAIWNQLDKAVLCFSKTRGDFAAQEYARFGAQTAAALRDRIGSPAWASHRAQYVAEAQQALATDEWWHSSVNGSGGGDD